MFLDARLWELTVNARGAIFTCVAVGVLASVVGVARLALLGLLIASVFNGAAPQDLVLGFIGVGLVMLLRGVLEHWRTMLAHRTAAKVQLALREQLHAHVMALGPAHFGVERTGEVMLSLVEGVEQLEVWFGEYLPQLFVAAITPVVIFALLAPLDLPVATVLLGFALFTLLAPAGFHRWDMANSLRRSRAYSAFAAEFLDSLQGLATLKSYGQSAARGASLADKAHEVFRSTMWVLATNSLTRGITDTGLALGSAAALAVGAYRVDVGTMEMSTLLMVLMAGIEVFRPQRDLRSLLHNGMMGMSAAEGIFRVLNAQPQIVDSSSPLALPTLPAEIQFDAVRFTYPSTPVEAHRGLSFNVKAGQRVGFVGSSGAGKSTILKLILRTFDVDTGCVKLGGVDVRELTEVQRCAQLAVVSQDVFLFHGTVRENLLFGRPDADLAALMAAAQAANALEFIERLPHGLDTIIGERGIRLSGGQRARLAIARALLRDAPVLILDEALSAVDAHNERLIQQALDSLMQNRTTLIFAHRLASVMQADAIHVLEQGNIVESGTHSQLLQRNGRYVELMREQLAGIDAGEGGVAAQAEQTSTQFGGGFESTDAVPDGTPLDAPSGELTMGGQAVSPSEPGREIVGAGDLGWMPAFASLFSYAKPYRIKLALTFVFGVARVLALIGIGVLSALAVANVKMGEPYSDYLWGLAIAAPAAGIIHWLESWVAHDMAFRMLAQMRVALFRKLDMLAPAYLTRRRSGDLVAMATHDVEMVEYFFAHTIAPACVAVLVPGAVVTALAWHHLYLALALIPFLALVAGSPFWLRAQLDELGSRDREALGELNAYVVDTVQGLAEIKAFGQASARRDGFIERISAHTRARLPFYADLSKQRASLEIATGLGALSVVVVGSILIDSGSLPAQVLPLLALLALAAFLPISEIAQIGRQLADTLGATRRLHQVEHERPIVEELPSVQPIDAEAVVGLEFDRVCFSYPTGVEAALQDVSFRVPRGTSLALVGPSGAGKTTIAQLCMRFWDADRGAVRVFDNNVMKTGLDDLRGHIALVSQETYLFNQTLRDNVMLARPNASPAELEDALRLASLSEFVSSLPDGLDTPVGERGMRLSGGQRQRVAIARAFLKDAPILVLDEATSHLDAINEQAIREALATLMVARTTIVIAHRLSTVRQCDQIAVLEAGEIGEIGSHDELIARNGAYAALLHQQQRGVA